MRKKIALFMIIWSQGLMVAYGQTPSTAQNYVLQIAVRAAGYKTVGSLLVERVDLLEYKSKTDKQKP